MIVKMKRYSFLVYHGQYTEFLEKVRETGVLHVIEKPEGIAENDALREKMQLAARTKTVINRIEKLIPKGAILKTETTETTGLELLIKIENKFSAKESLEQKLQLAERDRERMEVWGKFSHERLQMLKNAGFQLNFFSCNLRKFDQEWEVLYNAFEIDTVGTTRYFVTITKSEEPFEIDADPVKLSSSTAEQLDVLINDYRVAIENEKSELVNLAIENKLPLKEFQAQVMGDIDFSKVLLNTHAKADEKVMLLEGWCPEESEVNLNAYLEESGIYYDTIEPVITDDIPIKLKNSKFTKLFEPVTKLFSLPNYSELDPTPFLAPFFMLFFGLCLGDGGYGLLVLIVATFFKKKSSADMKGILTLGQYLGGMTILVGILTGSFFGIALDQVEWGWLKGVKSYFITQANYGNMLSGYNPMMILALIIGIIQILFGMIVNTLKINKQFGFKYAMSKLSWVFFIVSAILIFGLKSLGIILNIYLSYTLYAFAGVNALIIIFYNSPDKNPIANIGSALWDTYNMATGLLGDTLSYIRLFALGLTGSILGGVFNTLAFDLTADTNPYLRWLFVLLILLIGHTINFALSLIGAFVHPMRLTFVEFYKNSGFEGGGKAYQPFSKK